MEWLFKRFLYELQETCKDADIHNIDIHSKEVDALCKKYGVFADTHIKNNCNYGDVYSNEDFAKAVESGGFVPYDGVGYYIGTDLKETRESVDFNAEKIRSKANKYPYIFWYNK